MGWGAGLCLRMPRWNFIEDRDQSGGETCLGSSKHSYGGPSFLCARTLFPSSPPLLCSHFVRLLISAGWYLSLLASGSFQYLPQVSSVDLGGTETKGLCQKPWAREHCRGGLAHLSASWQAHTHMRPGECTTVCSISQVLCFWEVLLIV